jgi:predicted xylose isomerase-like sugar epimerase
MNDETKYIITQLENELKWYNVCIEKLDEIHISALNKRPSEVLKLLKYNRLLVGEKLENIYQIERENEQENE